jgi:hypothetical protein
MTGTVSAYEYFRNKALNAATYYGKKSGTPKAAFNQNQFGGTLGGKIVRDKAFFFGNYEQYKIITGTTFTAFVPTLAERGGDFSALCTARFVLRADLRTNVPHFPITSSLPLGSTPRRMKS